jgi:hypothetical protein
MALISQFKISTTGVSGTVPFEGLGKVPGYVHPVTIDLLGEFTLSEIQDVDSGVQAAIDTGAIVATNENDALISNILEDIYPTIIKDNLSGIVDPSSTDDLNIGYSVGSRWINVANDTSWTCTNNASGIASWTDGGGGTPSISMDDLTDADTTSITPTSGDLLGWDGTNWTPKSNAPQFFDAWESVGGVVISTGVVPIPLGTVRQQTSAFTFTPGGSEVTINEDGIYSITARLTTDISTGTVRSISQVDVQADSGFGFGNISGTVGRLYNRTATDGESTATVTFMCTCSAGDKLRIVGSRISGTSTIVTLIGGSSLTINNMIIGTAGGPGAGEINTASNIGSGIGVHSGKVGVDLQFKDIKAGTNKISVSEASGNINIDVNQNNVNHDSLQNYVANQHVDHSTVTISGGVGLSGGGDLTTSREIDLDFNSLVTSTSADLSADFFAYYDGDTGQHKKISFGDSPVYTSLSSDLADLSGDIDAISGVIDAGVPSPFFIASNTNAIVINSLTDILVPDMTITPPAGEYIVIFMGNGTFAKSTSLWVSIYENGVLIPYSPMLTSRGTSNGDSFKTVSAQATVIVDGTQAIDVRGRHIGSTGVALSNRSMIISKVL